MHFARFSDLRLSHQAGCVGREANASDVDHQSLLIARGSDITQLALRATSGDRDLNENAEMFQGCDIPNKEDVYPLMRSMMRAFWA